MRRPQQRYAKASEDTPPPVEVQAPYQASLVKEPDSESEIVLMNCNYHTHE